MTDQTRPATGLFTPSDFRINLEQQRKRAKDLQQALREREPTALQRFRSLHPRPDDVDSFRLSEAQLVIARELGLPSWPRLKAHIDAMDEARQTIADGAPAPDADLPTLHIRCGSDIQAPLGAAGFAGAFLAYGDPLCQGPLTGDPDWLARRAAFLHGSYEQPGGRSLGQIRAWLEAAENGLATAAQRYDRVALWFEHDSYDQLNLVRCLAVLAENPPRRLDLISLDRYPGSARFIGLGQLPPESLRLLWSGRREVTGGQLAAARTIWPMLRAADPRPLASAAAAGVPDLPYLAAALRRHCQELPWAGDGLSLTQRLVLQLLAERPQTIGQLFAELMRGREDLPWLGDTMFLAIVQAMKRIREPVFAAGFASDDRRWPREHLAITDLGRAILAGEADFLALDPPTRWVGGVPIGAGHADWRWDEAAGAATEVSAR
jgi:hypothetical protein